MRLTRQHFVMIAKVISESNLDKVTKQGLAHAFVVELRETNPSFDKTRFLEAATK